MYLTHRERGYWGLADVARVVGHQGCVIGKWVKRGLVAAPKHKLDGPTRYWTDAEAKEVVKTLKRYSAWLKKNPARRG